MVCNQNHDQIGNRAIGDRLTATPRRRPARASPRLLTLLGPFTPMLFMGEEWAASTPWQFFTSHPEPELGEATAEGRIAEFERDGLGPDGGARPAGPGDVHPLQARLVRARLGPRTRACCAALPRLAELRRSLPELTDPRFVSLLHRRRGHPGSSPSPRPALMAVNFEGRRRSRCRSLMPSSWCSVRRGPPRAVRTGRLRLAPPRRGALARSPTLTPGLPVGTGLTGGGRASWSKHSCCWTSLASLPGTTGDTTPTAESPRHAALGIRDRDRRAQPVGVADPVALLPSPLPSPAGAPLLGKAPPPWLGKRVLPLAPPTGYGEIRQYST